MSAALMLHGENASALERKFALFWLSCGGPKLEREHAFETGRKWRFDFAHPETNIAIEIEGGIWSKGRHVTPGGFIKDCEKYNTAALRGWLVFRLTDKQITVPMVEAIAGRIKFNLANQ